MRVTISGENTRINIGSADLSTNVAPGGRKTPVINVGTVDRSVNVPEAEVRTGPAWLERLLGLLRRKA